MKEPGNLKPNKKKDVIPDKLVYRLKEISRITKVDQKTIEDWEKEFYFLNAGQTASGKKIFRKKDLSIILRLKELLDNKGLTLAGAKRKIEHEFGIKSSKQVHPDRLKKVLSNVREQLQEISTSLNK